MAESFKSQNSFILSLAKSSFWSFNEIINFWKELFSTRRRMRKKLSGKKEEFFWRVIIYGESFLLRVWGLWPFVLLLWAELALMYGRSLSFDSPKEFLSLVITLGRSLKLVTVNLKLVKNLRALLAVNKMQIANDSVSRIETNLSFSGKIKLNFYSHFYVR